MAIDYLSYPVLYVDDEPANLVTMSYLLEGSFTIITSTSPKEALEIVRNQNIAVLLADQRMPEMTGAELCGRVAAMKPDIARLIITAYADLHTAMDAINRGQVGRYLTKPWRNEELVDAIRTAVEIVAMQRTMRELELRLLRGGPNNAATTLRSEIVHELTGPLQALTLNLEMLGDVVATLRKAPPTGDGRSGNLLQAASEAQQDAIAAVEQLQSVLQRVRQVPNARAAAPESRTDVARVVESTVRIVRADVARVAQLAVVIQESPTVTMDSTALSQVMINLLLNAAQALEGRNPTEERIVVRVGIDDGRAVVSISDSGPGIRPEEVQRIFDPFYTTKPTGTGLGLAIVRELMRGAGGEITVDSKPGEGAIFRVQVPLAPSSSSVPPKP